MSLKLLNHRGDTIVEVMIVLAVLGLAISISYATANRSLLNARQAQENSQATELAQSQLETLQTLTSTSAPINIFQSGPYCLSQTRPYSIAADCTQPSLPAPNNLSITFAAHNTFTVKVTWPDVLGQGNDTVTLIYRLYPQQP